jgi:4-amino-4-deoxy-L-arabinose transferase-like glycosyltransferase
MMRNLLLDVGVGVGARARSRGASGYTWVALLAPAFFFLYGLGAYPLRDNNEGLYSEIAREMLASGQFIIPHLNGVPYIEKPPLLYWLISLSMALFGPSATSARLVSAAAMGTLAFSLYLFARRHGHVRAGCYASVLLSSALPVVLVGRSVLFDPLLTALLGLCLLNFLHFCLDGAARALRVAMLWLALAVLAKGLVALVLVGGIGALFLLLARARRPWRAMVDPPALAMLIGVAGSWHIAALFRQDGFAWFYFINEHVLRFLGTRTPHDFQTGPLWYYLPRLLQMLMPWTPFLLLLVRPRWPVLGRLGSAGSGRLDSVIDHNASLASSEQWQLGNHANMREAGAEADGIDAAGATSPAVLTQFCQAWLVFPLVFFSLSQAKADYYLLLTAPALALWLGLAAEARIVSSGDRLLAACWGIAAAGCVLALALLPDGHGWRGWPLALLIMAGAALAPPGARLFAQLPSVRSRHLALAAIALAVAPMLWLVLQGAQQRSLKHSSRQLAQLIQQMPIAPASVYVYEDFEDVFSSLPFYLGHAVTMVDSTSRDLAFGCRMTPGACISAAQFRQLPVGVPIVVAVRAERAAAFQQMAGIAADGGPEWRVLAAGHKRLYVRSP